MITLNIHIIFIGMSLIIWRHSNWPLNVEAVVNFYTSSWINAIINPSKFLAIPKKEIYNFQILTSIPTDKNLAF